MLLAYDYPLLGVFWSLLIFSLFVLWIFIVIWCFIDDFRRRDHGGLAKALWFLFIVFIPDHRGVLLPGGTAARGHDRIGVSPRRDDRHARGRGPDVFPCVAVCARAQEVCHAEVGEARCRGVGAGGGRGSCGARWSNRRG